MRTKPPEVDDGELQRAIASNWLFDAAPLTHLAVGAGSHHWVAEDAQGSRRFVTVDDLELKPWLGADAGTAFPGLLKAYEVARRLRASGLDFVVAPISTTRGEVIVRLGERFTVALFPFVDGWTGDFDGRPGREVRDVLLRMWASLHAATPTVRDRAAVRGFEVTARADLDVAMNETDRDWAGGPLSTDARDWLASNRRYVREALLRFDEIAKTVSARGDDSVITHGEPHGLNMITSEHGRYLVDWDSVALALPERDLWMLDDGSADAFRPYEEATGLPVDRDALVFYGMVWHLSDIALFIELLRGEHRDDADTRKALDGLSVAAARLAAYMPR